MSTNPRRVFDPAHTHECRQGGADQSTTIMRMVLAVIVLVALGPPLWAQPGKALPLFFANLGLEPTSVRARGDLMWVPVSERRADRDLNSDGDATDNVLFVYQAEDRRLVNTGVNLGSAVVGPWFGDDCIAFRVPESEVGRDVNGDGDLFDYVAHVFDARTGEVVDLDLPLSGGFLVHGRRVIFSESGSGNTLLYELDSGQLLEPGLPAMDRVVAGERLLVEVIERWLDTDINEDGDLDDRILQLYDLATGSINDTGMQVELSFPPDQPSDYAAYRVYERRVDEDLNGDGDRLDRVVGVYDAAANRFFNLGIDALNTPSQSAGWIWWVVSERHLGNGDLNGDGDALDNVLWAYELETRTLVNSGQAVEAGYRTYGDLAAFQYEDEDGWARMKVYDAATRQTRELGYGSGAYGVGPGYVYFTKSEHLAGDLNGDGDTRDGVAHVYDRMRDGLRNLKVDALGLRAAGDWVAFEVFEIRQGRDLDRNGVLAGSIGFLYRVRSRRLYNSRLDAFGSLVLTPRLLAISAREHNAGRDLNGDGDLRDDVLQVTNLHPRGPRRQPPRWP